jgi:hypothetical protein
MLAPPTLSTAARRRTAVISLSNVLRLVLLGLSLLGWGVAAAVGVILVSRGIAPGGNPIEAMGGDSYAYWAAGVRLSDGGSLYAAEAIGQPGAYFYPPLFAQAWAPLAQLPLLADWGWRILGVLSIRYMARSWLWTGIWLLLPPTLYELTAGNVTFQMAALTVAGLRGRAEGIIPAAIVRYSSLAVVPFIWFRRPAARRGLLVGVVISALAIAASAVVDPDQWVGYLHAMGSQAAQPLDHPWIVRILPTAAADFGIRLAIAAVLILASIRFDSPHLAYVAAFLATPVMWQQRSVVLLALLTLDGDGWLRPYRWPWRTAPASPRPARRDAEIPAPA